MAVAITYNDNVPFKYIYSATSGGTVFGSNQANSTAFNYFPNSAVINDALYFGFNPCICFGNITFYVGTLLAGTGIVITWEYWGGSWKTLTVTDNTNGFATAGQNTVALPAPDSSWTQNTVNSVSATWVRARISSLGSITNGGAQSTQKVLTKNNGITIADPGNTVAGFCETAYLASQSGGWGVVKKQGIGSYFFDCNIFLGYLADVSPTHISDTNKMITLGGMIWGRSNNDTGRSVITFGTLSNDALRASKDGCCIKADKYWSRSFDGSGLEIIYSYSTLMDSSYVPYGIFKSYNSIFNISPYFTTDAAANGPIVYGSKFQKLRPDFIQASMSPNSDINGITVSDSTNTIRLEFGAYIKNLTNMNCTYIGDYGNSLTSMFDVVLIDPISPTYNIYFYGIPTAGGTILTRRHSVFANVSDSNAIPLQNVNMSILKADGTSAMLQEYGRATNAIGPSGVSLTASSGTFSNGDYINIGAEMVRVTGVSNLNLTVVRGQIGTRSSDHRSRQIAKLLQNTVTDASGNTPGGAAIQVETNRYSWSSGSAPGVTANLSLGPHTIIFYLYGYIPVITTQTITRAISLNIRMVVNPNISVSEATAAAITGVTINGPAKTITVTEPRTPSEIYDFSQWWASRAGNIFYDGPLITTNSIDYTLGTGWTLIIDGITIEATGKRSTGAYSLINGGDFTGDLVYAGTVRTSVQITGLTSGSLIQLYDTAQLYLGTVNATSFRLPYVWSVDTAIRLRVGYCDGVIADEFIERTQTLTSSGVLFELSPTADTVYSLNGDDGSLVTGITIDDSNLLVNVSNTGTIMIGNTPAVALSWAEIYAYNVYWLSTEAGIVDEGRFIWPTDRTHFTLYGFKIKNITDPSVPLVLTDGFGVDSVTGQSADIVDYTGGTVFCTPDNVVGFSYASGGLMSDERTKLMTLVAEKTDLTTVAKTTDLADLAKTTDLLTIAEKTDLVTLAEKTDLSTLAEKSDIAAIPPGLTVEQDTQLMEKVATKNDLFII